MALIEIPPEKRTVVMAGDHNYAWGVYLLAASMRRWKMQEKILIGTYSWSREWMDFMSAWPNVKVVRLSTDDQRCVAVTKPMLMLKSETDYVTWVDSDGFFTGNCSDYLYGEPEVVYARSYSPAELTTHTFARLPNTVATWVNDVASLPERRNIADVCANVVGVSLEKNTKFLEKWIEQMGKVLPDNVGIVTARNSPYFQTDESVLNSLLSCWAEAPEITKCYRLNNPKTAFFAHFAYNPKPWQQFWTPFALRYYDKVMDLMNWCAEEKLLPPFVKPPPTLLRKNERYYRMCAPAAEYYFRIMKRIRKLTAGW